MKPTPCPKCKATCDTSWIEYRVDRLKRRGGNVFQGAGQCSLCGVLSVVKIKKFPHVVKPKPATRKKNYRG